MKIATHLLIVTLFTALLISGCIPSPPETSRLKTTIKTKCPKILEDEALNLYKEVLLYEFDPEVRRSEKIRTSNPESSEIRDYYYRTHLLLTKGLRFATKFDSYNCYLDSTVEQRLGYNFENLNYQFRSIGTPLDDLLHYQIILAGPQRPQYTYAIPCTIRSKATPEIIASPSKYAAYRKENIHVFRRLEKLNAILAAEKSDFLKLQNWEFDTPPAKPPVGITTIINHTQFFCDAYSLLDHQSECSEKDPDLVRFCQQMRELNQKLGAVDAN